MNSYTPTIQVLKRNGQTEAFDSGKIHQRIMMMAQKSPSIEKDVDVNEIVSMSVKGLVDKVKTMNIDELVTANCVALGSKNTAYFTLASRMIISNLHKETPSKFSDAVNALHNYVIYDDVVTSVFQNEFVKMVNENKEIIDSMIDHEADYRYQYFGYKTLEKSYLKRKNDKICDRPQYMLMRVALMLHGTDFEKVKKTYQSMSNMEYTHASPTLFNACTRYQQLASCFLMVMKKDDLGSIFDTFKEMALISKGSGGIGVAIDNLRGNLAPIQSTGGHSKGPCSFMTFMNIIMKIVDQGGGKRPGGLATYIETHNSDILEYLTVRTNSGNIEKKTFQLQTALWISDLFMDTFIKNPSNPWYLFSSHRAPGLNKVWGLKYKELYEKYVQEKRFESMTSVGQIMNAIAATIIETSMPYILFKDQCNRKSNQQNLGTIECSNLCTEIIQYSSPDEITVCTLASIGLPKCISVNALGKKFFDFEKLRQVVHLITENLNKVINCNMYPPVGEYVFDKETGEKKFTNFAENSSKKHRPIGIGVQGLADVFMLLMLPFDSPEAKQLNKDIFETIYFASLEKSNEIAKILNKTYESYHQILDQNGLKINGSPVSRGILQMDMWSKEKITSDRWDWTNLRENIKKYGVYNSLLVAPMPTKSTSHIMGNVECFEPITSLIYKAKVLSGEFIVTCSHLRNTLEELGLWSEDLQKCIILEGGSIQNIEIIPKHIRDVFKTAYEIPWQTIQDMAKDRAPFIDQSQSLNYFLANPTVKTITELIVRAYTLKLKTGMYYLYQKPVSEGVSFNISPSEAQRLSRVFGLKNSSSLQSFMNQTIKSDQISSSIVVEVQNKEKSSGSFFVELNKNELKHSQSIVVDTVLNQPDEEEIEKEFCTILGKGTKKKDCQSCGS